LEAKVKLYKIRDLFAVIKYRFDIGMSFMIFLNFSLLVITASNKLQKVLNISTLTLCLIFIPLAFLGTSLFGFLLDKVFKYQTAYVKYIHSHSPQITKTLAVVEDIQKRLDKIEKR